MISYPDSVEYLYSLGNEVKTIKLGLERITTLLENLGNPHLAYRTVHVAGTNGKGSTCAMMEAGLRAAGLRTGLYTSPHLVEPTERIRLSGENVTVSQFTAAFNLVHELAIRLLDEGKIDGHPTYFETVTAMAFWIFAQERIEIAVVEVGLGGRFDATNVVHPELCVITPIDFDHESWLGSSIPAIASEKAGIIKPGVPVVVSRQKPEAWSEILKTNPICLRTSDWTVSDLKLSPYNSEFKANSLEVHCPLAGEHQVENALVAAIALDRLGIPPGGIAQAKWPGRLERVATSPDVILDGAHNPAGVRALAAYIRRFFSNRKVWLIYATMRDKSVDEIGELLAPAASEIILTQVDSPRALRPEALQAIFDHPRLRSTPNLAAALEIIRNEAGPEDAVFITGSLYLVGEARPLFVR
jgi:dihydrofolate synthase/folylpolyglutamate synthase